MTSIEEVNVMLSALSSKVKASKTLGEQITAWGEWCKLFDAKGSMEDTLREDAKVHEL